MSLLSLVSGLVGLARGLVGWLDDRQKIEAGKAQALKDTLDETLELVDYAERVDRSTDSLSRDARERVRRAIRRKAGSDE